MVTMGNPKIMLPVLKHGGSYALDSDFYNLSITSGSTTYYVVLGVLRISGETVVNLRNYKTDAIELTTLSHSSFDYTSLADPLNTGISFSNIGSGDSIHFLCLHDSSFDINNGGAAKLDTIRNKIVSNISSSNYISMLEPNEGDGGILKASGCSF